MMKVLVINNDGGGFADFLEVPHGITVAELFHRQLGHDAKPDRYLIRVNRQPVAQHEVLKDGDRLSITPTKIEGAG
jgi:hypothetical protein